MNRRVLSLILALGLALTLGIAPALADNAKLTVGASPTPHGEILGFVVPLLAEQGVDLIVTEFTDYVLPNLALEEGDLDANYFQHRPYLNDFNANNGTHLVWLADVHYEPMGIYPGKVKSLADLPDGAEVAVPNDTTNEARALLLLEAEGLIKLPEGAGLDVTVKDIAENPKNLKITELEAAQIPRALPDFDIAVINGNYALEAGLVAGTDALAIEGKDSLAADTFANGVVVKEGNEENEAALKLVEVLHSDAVRAFIEETYKDAGYQAKF
ncbi:MAG: MetQ/NlpA family ABC transporter substrate-binding protein [Oscillospiraceae bacterium]|jgi:D-methionine transport system substrate-binding protein|nr:MetQ/NlpA family ABC transporter substrate-binding protein [Oscillospiraceae bacterium]